MLRGGHHGSGVGTMAKSGPNNNNTIPSGVCTINQISVNTVNKACASNPAQTHSGVGTAANSASTMPKAKDGTYLAVSLFKRNAGTAPNLLDGSKCHSSITGSLFNGNPARIKLCHTAWDFANKMNVMTSFDCRSLECGCCTEHTRILEKWVLSRPVYRRTFVLTDQNFIATAPATTADKQCLKIVRVENASLWDHHNYFRDFIWDRDLAMPVGSCILLGSASHLGNVGPSLYAEELVQIRQRLNTMFDGTFFFIPCPPMLVDGSSDPTLVRAILEIAAWLRNIMAGDNCFLPDTYRVMTGLLFSHGSGGAVASNMRIMMPAGLLSGNRSRWDSGGTNLPAGVLLLSAADEASFISTLINELNSNLNMDLDSSPDMAPTAERRKTGPLLLMVGTSHANRTADALEREGATEIRAVILGWRALKQKIPPMVELIRARLSTVRGDCIVIFQLFDNRFYMARTEEGGLIPAVKEASRDSKYHIHGELVFTPKEL